MTVSFLNWGVHVWRPSHILRPTPGLPRAPSRQYVVANVIEEPKRDLLDYVAQERILDGVIIVEVMNRLDDKFFELEASRERQLGAQHLGLLAWLWLCFPGL